MQAYHNVEKIDHSLELEEKLSHQIKGWKAQKICGILMMVVVLLTALGLFGNGILSKKEETKAGVNVRYERFLRYEREMTVSWRISGQNEVRVSVPQHYLDLFKIEKVTPDAYEAAVANGQLTYTFKVKGEEAAIRFYLNPQKTGGAEGAWTVNGQAFQLSHFIYP